MEKNGVATTADDASAHAALGVLALCFVFNVIGRGIGDTYMVFLLPLGQEFGWHRSQMTSVYSTLMIASGLAAPLAGYVFERWGPRVSYGAGLSLLATGYLLAGHADSLWHFYLCIGLLGGLGMAAVGMVPAAALISRWFRRRLSTALGLAYAGFGCGSLLIVPMVQAVINKHGWRYAYAAIGVALLLVLAVSMLLPWRAIRSGVDGRLPTPSPVSPPSMSVPPGSESASESSQRGHVKRALRDRRFWMLLQVMFFTATGMYLVIVQSVAYLIEVGFTPLQAAGAFGTAGLLSIIGVSSSGWLADTFGQRRAATFSFVGTIAGTAMLFAMTFGPTFALLVAYVLCFGICQGARGPLIAGMSARIFAGPGQSTVYGIIFACMSIGSGIGALLAGALYDLTGGYRTGFILSMVCVLLAATPFWTSHALHPARAPGAE